MQGTSRKTRAKAITEPEKTQRLGKTEPRKAFEVQQNRPQAEKREQRWKKRQQRREQTGKAHQYVKAGGRSDGPTRRAEPRLTDAKGKAGGTQTGGNGEQGGHKDKRKGDER